MSQIVQLSFLSVKEEETILSVIEEDLGGVYSTERNGTERNGTERNDGLNYGMECFLKLKIAAYHYCTSYRWHFQLVNN